MNTPAQCGAIKPPQPDIYSEAPQVWLGCWELLSTNSRSGPKCASIGLAHEL